jgi:hypothetical protein
MTLTALSLELVDKSIIDLEDKKQLVSFTKNGG